MYQLFRVLQSYTCLMFIFFRLIFVKILFFQTYKTAVRCCFLKIESIRLFMSRYCRLSSQYQTVCIHLLLTHLFNIYF